MSTSECECPNKLIRRGLGNSWALGVCAYNLPPRSKAVVDIALRRLVQVDKNVVYNGQSFLGMWDTDAIPQG